ncbi:FAD binding domain-containing protein [Halioxenophilus sp. WMMB6]|uniref:FAD binding domain-containing protein n=1 Tax=Halioxenophilus sp. WMMB6 TaxID=3073815 RepID=UPI00295E50CD|nr:FAD binding domain-containing protein [Halioxenophilus sp. WMMB6]
MKPAPFDYYAPTTVAEACALLAEAGGGATLLAGGQTLMPLLNLRMSQPFILVDINHIEALHGIKQQDDAIHIGPATRQHQVIESPLLQAELPVITQAVRHVGHHQTRNRGTVGGSIALGEPAAELPATAVALGATLTVQSVRGSRRLTAQEFYLGPYMNALEPDELVIDIAFPKWPTGHITLFEELAQRPGDFALAGVVGALALDNGVISRAGIAWFAMGPTPLRATTVESMLLGKVPTEVDVAAVVAAAIAETAPFDDQQTSAEYRRVVGAKLLQRTLTEALAREEVA